jgi:hypothetical protein
MLRAEGIAAAIVNPRAVRRFAEAMGFSKRPIASTAASSPGLPK